MNAEVKLISNMKEVQEALNMTAKEFLTIAGGEVMSEAKKNTRVDTGQTRDGWSYELEDENTVCIGNIEKNAVWEEFGTGIYAEDENGVKNGMGRQTPWIYEDRKGVTHFTRGKTATHALTKAMDTVKTDLKEIAEDKYRSAMK